MHAEENNKPRGRTPEREGPEERTPRPARPGQASELNDISMRDSVSMTSISSYRTAEESPIEGESTPSAPQHDTESSTVSTETPTRRKSVRVSLQPTFSPTPPALEDDEGHSRYPWNSTKGDNHDESSEPVIWQDSSDEDEEYYGVILQRGPWENPRECRFFWVVRSLEGLIPN